MAFMPKISNGFSHRLQCRTSQTQYQNAMAADARPAISTANDVVQRGLLTGTQMDSGEAGDHQDATGSKHRTALDECARFQPQQVTGERRRKAR